MRYEKPPTEFRKLWRLRNKTQWRNTDTLLRIIAGMLKEQDDADTIQGTSGLSPGVHGKLRQ